MDFVYNILTNSVDTAHFIKLLENSTDILTILDKNFKVAYVSPSVFQILGWIPETELIGINPLEKCHPDDIPILQEKLKVLLEKPDEVQKTVFRYKHKNNEWRTLESIAQNFLSDSAIQGIVINSRDITERESKNRETSLLSTAIRSTANSIVITDPNLPDNPIIYVNPAFEKLTGYKRNEIIGKNCRLLQGEETDQNAIEKMRKAVAANKRCTVTLLNYRKDGSAFWNRLTLSPVFGKNKELVNFIGIQQDFTKFKEAEQIRKNEDLEKALLADIKNALAEEKSIKEIIQRCAEEIIEHLKVASVKIWILNEENEKLYLEANSGAPIEITESQNIVEIGRGVIGKIAKSQKVYLTNNIEIDFFQDTNRVKDNKITEFAGYPLIIQKKLIGIIGLFSERELPERVVELLSATSDSIAYGIERKISEEAMKASEERYRAFVSQSTQGIWRFEVLEPIPISQSPEKQLEEFYRQGYLAECNDMMAQMYGYSHSDEIVGARLNDFMPKADKTNIEYLTAFINSGYKLRAVESHEFDKYGNEKYFENSLVGIVEDQMLIRVWGSQTDITERKQAEESFHYLTESLPHIIWTATPEGTINYYNKSWVDYTGLTFEESRKEGWNKVIHPEDLERCIKLWKQGFESGLPYEVEFRMRKGSDHTYRWFLGKCVPVRNANGEVTKWFGTCTDIHERRVAEERSHFLAEANKILSSSLDYETTLRNLVNTIVPHFADWCTISMDPGSTNTKLVVAHRDPEKIRLVTILKEKYPIYQNPKLGSINKDFILLEEITSEVIENISINDEHRKILKELDLRSYLSIPLKSRGKRLGIISFMYSGEGRRYSEDMIEFAQELAHRAAIAVDNARLFRESQKEIEKRKRIEKEIKKINHDLEERVEHRTYQLQKAQERFYDIFESSKDGITYTTLDGKFLDSNRAYELITGYTRDELASMNFSELTPKKDYLREQEYVNEVIKTGESKSYEKQYIRKDGKLVDVSITTFLVKDRSGMPAGLCGVVKDISELRKSHKALGESEERSKSIIASLQEGIIFRDKEGNIQDCNVSAEKIFGVTKEELKGSKTFNVKGIWKVIDETGNPLEESQQPYALCIKTNAPITNFIVGMIKEGEEQPMWLSINTQPIRRAGRKKPYAIVSSYSVITDEKIAEEKLRELNIQLERSNKELQDFASVASHDLQEPLRKVQTFGDRLRQKDGNKLSEEGKDYLDRMQNAASRMRTLINDLLTFSRITTKAQPFEKVKLNKIIEEVLSDLEITAEEAGAIISVDSLPAIEADPTQMRQLFQNLISNALKFKKKEVTPSIDIFVKGSENEKYMKEDFKNEENCTIIVKDNGIGFEEKYVDRIFNVFQRLHTREEYEGTGVGLAVCRKITERHGGDITAQSKLGKGSEFIITLPLKQIK
jgi:two-component system, LuxR family, sensor kinase FixL